MDRQPFFQLYKQVSPETRRPFRIVETCVTVDGPRSRLTDFCFATEAEARFTLDKMNMKREEPAGG